MVFDSSWAPLSEPESHADRCTAALAAPDVLLPMAYFALNGVRFGLVLLMALAPAATRVRDF